jgi:hypothetical protein
LASYAFTHAVGGIADLTGEPSYVLLFLPETVDLVVVHVMRPRIFLSSDMRVVVGRLPLVQLAFRLFAELKESIPLLSPDASDQILCLLPLAEAAQVFGIAKDLKHLVNDLLGFFKAS